MKNIVGQTPRGEDFFPRDKIINLIYRRLNSGVNVYMAAPRRVGKTAIMRYLEDNPKENYEFRYIITESIDNPINYFKRLSEALHHLKSLSEKSIGKIKDFMPKIGQVSLVSTGVDVKFTKEVYEVFEEFKNLIKDLETQGKTVVIMVDEFPQTVENILRKHGHAAAEQFLQFNREIRHQANANVRFLLTGSIGLPSIAEKLDATKEINDLNTVEIPPLNREEAQQLVTELFASEQVLYNDDTIEYLLDKINYFVPFHLQLLVQGLIDIYFENEEQLDKKAVDKAFGEVLDKRNDMYFVHYYSRLKDTFEDENEYNFALAVLNTLSQKDKLIKSDVIKLARLDNHSRILRVLEFDGYIFSSQDGFYQFTSPVLKLWWEQYVV
ncbi:ATP-binding protein [Candidatus Halobeggiatoa sp. HSG11]|nr:ATP-binding protein [Candidatus Halobeggiatoa sp. HSG11]